ncbi:MAG: hypothetical protein HGA49_06060 [Eubacteriaceae bacterium]|nr:hypothetical protein [Eubacteriaceae bacterium]
MGFKELIAMKKVRSKPSEGDVFVIQPKEGTYYYGKVILTNIKSKDSFINGMSLVYIYNKVSSQKNAIEGVEDNDLLIPPIIVNNQPWQKGYFETVGNVGITENEMNVDFGFWDTLKKKFVNCNGDELLKKPKYWTHYGLGSFGVVGKEVQKALNEGK